MTKVSLYLSILFPVLFVSSCENLSLDSVKKIFSSDKQSEMKTAEEKKADYNYEMAMPECQINNASACYFMGRYNTYKKDPINAAFFYKKSCDLNYEIGCAYETLNEIDIVVSKLDPNRKMPSEKIIESRLDKYCGNEQSLDLKPGLVCEYLSRYYFDISPKKSYSYIDKACNLDSKRACAKKNRYVFDGIGVQKNERKAIESFRADCFANSSESCAALGYLYYTGKSNYLKKDFSKSFEFIDKACNLGLALGCFAAGVAKYKGEGVEKNLKDAVVYWEKGASMNEFNSMCNLGYFYMKGIEVNLDKKKAKELYQGACLINQTFKENFEEFSTYGKTACEVANEL